MFKRGFFSATKQFSSCWQAGAKQRRHFFTFVEIMVVVGLLALLAAIAVPSFIQARQHTRLQICMSNLKTYQGMIELYSFHHSRYPADVNSLVTENYLDSMSFCPIGGSYTWSVNAEGTEYHMQCTAKHTPTVSLVFISHDHAPTAQ